MNKTINLIDFDVGIDSKVSYKKNNKTPSSNNWYWFGRSIICLSEAIIHLVFVIFSNKFL